MQEAAVVIQNYVESHMNEKEKIQVRVELEGDLLDKVNTLKKFYGIESYAELVRLLLNERYRNLENQAGGLDTCKNSTTN